MKLQGNDKYVKAGVTVFLTVLALIVCYFILLRIDALSGIFHKIIRILKSFLYGGVLAYLLTPVCRRLERLLDRLFRGKNKKLSAGLAVAVSLLLGIVVMGLIIMIVIPQVWDSIVSLANVLPGQLKDAYEKLYAKLEDVPDVQNWVKDVSEQTIARLETWSKTDLLPTATTLLGDIASYMSNIFVVFKDALLGIVISVYLLATRRKFTAQGKLLLRGIFSPVWVDRIEGEVRYIDRMFNGFFMGKLVDSALIGILCFIGCLALRLPSAPLISVIVGITNIIPMFGPFIGAVPCTLLLLLENPIHALTFVIFLVILQQLDGNLIGPRIMGNTTGLSGFWVTFAIVLFGGIWGLTGMLVGVPLLAVLYDLIRRLVYRSLRKRDQEQMIIAYNADFHPDPAAAQKRLGTLKIGKKKKKS